MPRFHSLRYAKGIVAVLAVILVSPWGSAELVAQETTAESAVRCFEHFAKARSSGSLKGNACPGGGVSASAVVLHPDRYSELLVEGTLDELMLVAINSDSRNVRGKAIAWLAYLGRKDNPRPEHVRPGIVARLTKVYEQSTRLPEIDAHLNQTLVVDLMERQVEVAAAARFLEEVARQAPNHRWARTLPEMAVTGLRRMGSTGARHLMQLRDNPPQRDMPPQDPSGPVFIHD